MKLLVFFYFLFFSGVNGNEFYGYGTIIDVLDTKTTKKYQYTIPNGQLIDIGLDSLIVYQCRSFDRDMINDQYALVHLLKREKKDENNSKKTIFLGWIVKSSPSLVVIEHPTYEIKLNRCLRDDPLYLKKKSIN